MALIPRRAPVAGRAGSLRSIRTAAFTPTKRLANASENAAVGHFHGSNTVVVFGKQVVLKLFRYIGEGMNPDFEVTCFLTDHGFAHSLTVMGALEYYRPHREPMTLRVVKRFSPSSGTAWDRSLAELGRYWPP